LFDCDTFKRKFEKLAFAKKPTGQAELPLLILCVKTIKDKISAKECIGITAGNNSDVDIEVNEEVILKEGNIGVHPTPLKHQQAQTAEAIALLGKDQIEAASKLALAISKLGRANNSPDSNRINDRLICLEDEVGEMKESISNVNLTLEKIYLLKK